MTIERDELGFDAPAPLGHPGRLGLEDGRSLGPEIGERLPDFSLPDFGSAGAAQGKILHFHEDRGNAPAAVVFYRSAVW